MDEKDQAPFKASLPSGRKFRTCPGHQMMAQADEAARNVRYAHNELLARGYTWDGMDGYSKTGVNWNV